MSTARESQNSHSGLDLLWDRARGSQRLWNGATAKFRSDAFSKLRSILVENTKYELASNIALEIDKPEFEVLATELLPLLESLQYAAAQSEALFKTEQVSVRVAPHKEVKAYRKPRGVVLIVAPSNFPLSITGTEILQAVAARNAVVIKPSPARVDATKRLLTWFQDAGFPKSLVQMSVGDAEHVRQLISDKPDYVTFIGSTAAGRQVGSQCALLGIPHRTELGGKAAALVLSNADMQRTANAIVWGAFMGRGHICAGIQRVFVDNLCRPKFMSVLLDALNELQQGREIFSLSSTDDTKNIGDAISDAETYGGNVYWTASEENDIAVVLDCPDARAKVFHEEIFSALFAVTGFDSVEEGIAALNDGPGDLTTYVFGTNFPDGLRQRIDASVVMTNDVLWSYGMPEVPWGGGPKSSSTATHGYRGLEDYTEIRHTISNRAPISLRREPYWFPYTDTRKAAIRNGIGVLYGTAKTKVKSLASFLTFDRAKGHRERKADSE